MNVTVDERLNNHEAWPQFDADENSGWITVDLGPGRPNASVYLRRTDEGLIIDVFPVDGEADEPVGSTYVFDNELEVTP